MHLLKNNSIVKLSFSFNFAIRFTFTNLSFLKAENWSFFKIIILLRSEERRVGKECQ